MYRLMFFTFLILFLASCTKVVEVPVPIKEPDPAEDPIFSTLDFATPQHDEGYGLAVSGSDLYVAGWTEGDLDGTNQGSFDGILRRYNGLKLWGVQFGTRVNDSAKKIATDSDGNVYVVGHTSGPLGLQVGSEDVFLVKFNKDGELLWGKQFGTKKEDFAIDLVIDSNNRIYVLSIENFNGFVIRKFSSGGSLIKTKPIAFTNRPRLYPKAMTIDNQNRLIVLTDWDNNDRRRGRDIELFKYTSNFNLVWQSAYSTISDDYAYDITADGNNNIYFTFDTKASDQGGHFVKKNANGNTIYTKRLEYSATSSNTYLKSITTDSNNNIYIAGYTLGSFLVLLMLVETIS